VVQAAAHEFKQIKNILSPPASRSQKGIEIKRRISSILSAHPPKMWAFIWKMIVSGKSY
jgi:hypothetical protein